MWSIKTYISQYYVCFMYTGISPEGRAATNKGVWQSVSTKGGIHGYRGNQTAGMWISTMDPLAAASCSAWAIARKIFRFCFATGIQCGPTYCTMVLGAKSFMAGLSLTSDKEFDQSMSCKNMHTLVGERGSRRSLINCLMRLIANWVSLGLWHCFCLLQLPYKWGPG